MKYLCGRCIHKDACLVPRSTGCVEECKYFKEMPSHLPKQTNEEYLRSLNTEQLAEFLIASIKKCKSCASGIGADEVADCPFGECGCHFKDEVVEWLKQSHTKE